MWPRALPATSPTSSRRCWQEDSTSSVAALCYDILGEDGLRSSYALAARRFSHVRFSFIHNTSGEMQYVHKHHRFVAEQLATLSPSDFPWGGSYAIDNGRVRFWSAPTHWLAWKGQFERVFFD